jgi:ClpX C4-type zinc finger protein
MSVDRALLQQATRARDRFVAAQHEADRAQVSYQHAIRRLHASGASLREIADALGLSYQRVHQIVDPSSGKGALKDATAEAACAFCGRADIDAHRLIAGPGLFICERCVDLAGEVLVEDDSRSDEHATIARVDRADVKARCGFCGKRRSQVEGMAEAPMRPPVGKGAQRRRPGVRICAACVALCGEILAERGG